MNETIARITPIVAKFAKDKDALEKLGPATRFKEDLGISSASIIDIVLDLEDTFGLVIKDDELKRIDTIGAAAQLIQEKQAAVAG